MRAICDRLLVAVMRLVSWVFIAFWTQRLVIGAGDLDVFAVLLASVCLFPSVRLSMYWKRAAFWDRMHRTHPMFRKDA